jgi:ribose 5-phosphate isomerase B
MMVTLDDNKIHEIVQRVLTQVLGSSTPVPEQSPLEASPATSEGLGLPEKSEGKKVVALGADHGGFELKEMIKNLLGEQGFTVKDIGTHSKAAVDYPDYAHAVAKLVATGKAWRGIMIDGAGIGSCIVANKVPGVRAGMAYDHASAVNSREHNDVNILTLGAGLIGTNLAKQIVTAWLGTDFGGDRHKRRVEKISAVEKEYMK